MSSEFSLPSQRRLGRAVSITAAVLGASAVALGAFGTHSLRDVLSAESLATFDTAVRYQLIHAVVLLVVAQLTASFSTKWIRRSGYLFGAGIILFSGSLYGLVLTGWSAFGPITPVGGACLIAGWLCLVVASIEAGKA